VGGSDAHTLRRVGRTWTEAPGATREEFLAHVAAGRGRVAGDHGGTVPLAADIYGVIARYHLGIVGLQRLAIGPGRRAFGIAFSLVSVPFQFTPFLVAARSKWHEDRWVRRCTAQLDLGLDPALDAAAGSLGPGA
jgi:PHP-associated